MASEYRTPGVFMPPASGVVHQAPRERTEIDPDAKGGDRAVAKTTEAPPSQAVRKPDSAIGPETGDSGSDQRPDIGPKIDPASLVKAQEIAGKREGERIAREQGRTAVASPAQMVGAPQELDRLDENGDGRIDQLELQHALRAEGEDTTYAALSQYQKSVGTGKSADGAGEPADKLFAEEIAKAKKEELLKAVSPTPASETNGNGDSPETPEKGGPTVKIVV